MYRFNRIRYYVIALCTIALATHIIWFEPSSVLTHSDWSYWPISAMKQLWNGWGSWLSFEGLGSSNIQIPFLGFNLVWSLFAHLGLSYDAATKVTFLIPVALLGFLSPFFLSLKIHNNKNIAFTVSLTYASTTYFLLRQTAHLPIALVYSLAPLILLILTKAYEKATFKAWLKFYLLSFIALIYEIRIFIIVLFICFLYSVIAEKLTNVIKNLKPLVYGGAIFLLLNIFWLAPTLLGGAGASINAVADRGLFGNTLFDLKHAIALSESGWTGTTPNESFQIQPILIYLWTLPIIAFVSLLLLKKYNFQDKKRILFLSITAFMGIILTKQSAAPLNSLYETLYDKLPGFNLYREASKFYLITALAYAMLAGYTLNYLRKKSAFLKLRQSLYLFFTLSLIIVAAVNLYPLVSGSMRTMFINRKEPNDYAILKHFLDTNESTYGRSLWVPIDSRWGEYNLRVPKVNYENEIQTDWLKLINNTYDSQYVPSYSNIVQTFDNELTSKIVGLSSVKYVILPLRDAANDDDFFTSYGDNRDSFKVLLDSASWLKKINISTSKVAVYKNTTYKSYFTTTNQLEGIQNFNNINNYYDFQKDGLGSSGLDFASSGDGGVSKKTDAPVRGIGDISSGLSAKNFSDGELTVSQGLNTADSNTLYANTAEVAYSYQVQNNSIGFTAQNANDLQVNGADIGAPVSSSTVASAAIKVGQTYSLAQGNTLYNINQFSDASRTIGATNDALNLYSSPATSNLVFNGSFEDGLWQSKVQDCNDYDNKAAIGMQRSTRIQTDGRYSLLLSANNHTACTSSNAMPVVPGQSYSLQYDYQISGGQRAGYDLVFNDAKHTVLSADQIRTSGRWYNLDIKFLVPAGASSVQVRLKGYPDDQNKQHSHTFYDNVIVQPLSLVSPVAPASTPQYKVSALSGNSLHASIVNSSFTYKNLFVNPSLEQGLWQKKVGDCNAYDNNPLLSMELNKNDKTNGQQSLELDATRHVACTGPPSVPVQEGKSYLLSFDYKSPDAPQAGYYVSFDDPNGTVISEQIPVTDHVWHNFTKSFVVPFGATHLSLSVYSYADQYGGIKEVNLYDNFSLVQIPAIQNRYYVVSTPTQVLKQPQHIAFELDSPTKKQVQVAGASTPFYLNMSESYHPQWRLELDDAKANGGLAGWLPTARPTAVPAVDHFNYDDFLNSWYVDPAMLCAHGSTACHKNADGTYDLKLIAEFAPQRYFYVGLVISGVTLAGCLGYLSYVYIRPRYQARRTKTYKS